MCGGQPPHPPDHPQHSLGVCGHPQRTSLWPFMPPSDKNRGWPRHPQPNSHQVWPQLPPRAIGVAIATSESHRGWWPIPMAVGVAAPPRGPPGMAAPPLWPFVCGWPPLAGCTHDIFVFYFLFLSL
jgi:hypothetical protein